MAVKRCRAAFSVWADGIPRVIAGGELIDDTDPVYRSHRSYFEDVETYVADRSPAVEDTTAEPGAKRDVSASTTTTRRGRPPKNKDA